MNAPVTSQTASGPSLFNQPGERGRSHTRKGPGLMPYRRTEKGRKRLARATGPGSMDIDSEIHALIVSGKAADAAKLYDAHKARTHKSGAWKRSRFGLWHGMYSRGDDRARGVTHD